MGAGGCGRGRHLLPGALGRHFALSLWFFAYKMGTIFSPRVLARIRDKGM